MKIFILFEGRPEPEFRCALMGPGGTTDEAVEYWYRKFVRGCRDEEAIPTVGRFVDWLVRDKEFERVEVEEVYLP
jgi:hypothetical protein